MSDKEKVEIEDIVDVLKELDQKDLTLLQSGAEMLKARKELDKQEQAPAQTGANIKKKGDPQWFLEQR